MPVTMTGMRTVTDYQNVRLVAVKESQDGRAIVLRLVEVEGHETEARVRLSAALVGDHPVADQVDTLERRLVQGAARIEGGTLLAKLSAFGIVTVRIGESSS